MNTIEIVTVLRNIAYGIECAAAVTGLFFLLVKGIPGPLKWFPIFLTYIFLNDIIGFSVRHLFPNSNNLILYNISTTITFIFYFLIYYTYIKEKTEKNYSIRFLILYIITLIFSGFFENYLNQLQSIPFLLGAVLLMVNIILYYVDILKAEQPQEVAKNLLFWISAGLLIYYVGKIPFRIVRAYYANQNTGSILFILNIILTIVMNTFFIVGFIASSKRKKHS